MLNAKIEAEKKELLGGGGSRGDSSSGSSKSAKSWSNEEIQHLIKAVNLFPAGTNNRCVTICVEPCLKMQF